MPYTMDPGAWGWMMALMLLIPTLAGAVVAALIVWAVRSSRLASGQDAPDTPLAILQRRFARGDIGADEYERMRATLTKS